MDGEMFAACATRSGACGRDPQVRCILLAGQGRHFTAGLDLEYASRQFPPAGDPGRAAEARLRHIEWLQDAFNAVEQTRVPVVAAVHGACVGAGVDLIGACDLRVASRDAISDCRGGRGDHRRSRHAAAPHPPRAPRIAARARLYRPPARRRGSGADRPGQRPRRRSRRGDEASLSLARTIAAKSPLAIAGAKRSLNYSRGRTVEEGSATSALWNAGTLVSADLGAAIQARLAKSDPSFGPLDD
jgi:enoyl-CoA hydratase/carnithine racemase